MPSLRELTGLIKNPTAGDVALVEKAYAFAEESHKNHKRYSGEPYFTHLIETAKILAGLGMGGTTIAAGLLHDAIEDAGVKPETIKRKFGEKVLSLVEGVTKLGHLQFRGENRYSEGLRRFFVATSKDARVLIIKLADRLHNMRTLSYVPKEKQLRIAKETLTIYAPLAYRLGIRKINRELEELAFPRVYPEEYEKTKHLLKRRSEKLLAHLEKFHKSLLKALARQGITAAATEHRLKGLYSLYQKLEKREWDIEKIYDVLAIRIIVKTVEDCYRVLGAIHAVWRPLPGRIKDYIAFPKPNGYQSVHTSVFTGDGGIVEIQIRTEEMHREAEYGIAAHFEYKELKSGGRENSSYFAWLKEWLASLIERRGTAAEEDERRRRTLPEGVGDVPAWILHLGEVESSGKDTDFLEALKSDFFKNRVFVFSPKGDVVDLPLDSSPIDFAYAIHSDIGDRVFGAKVNGKLVSLDTALHNGDIVEILTKTSARPSEKWLGFAKTTVAKKHIRNALQKLGVRS